MSAENVTYVSKVRVEPVEASLRQAWLPAEEHPVAIGSHGALAAHYGYPDEPPFARASALDYLVAALAGCLAGAIAGALRARGIDVAPGLLSTEAEGDVIPDDDGVLALRRVEVHHRLRLRDESQVAAAERAHAVHARACAVHRSIAGAVEVATTLEIDVDREHTREDEAAASAAAGTPPPA